MSKQKVFIHTNNKQGLGAILSKYSFERDLGESDIKVEYINVDNLDIFKNFAGKKYKRSGFQDLITYDPNDLQSFTLSRFMPPELMGYEGRAIVVDPDIFAIKNVKKLFELDLKGKAIAACGKKDAWDTSLMVMDCAKLKHWNIKKILNQLTSLELDYAELVSLKTEPKDFIMEIPRDWNDLDHLGPSTNLIHMTNRMTQPWRTGLPIDFTINPMPKILGIIPRELIHKLLGKYPTHYKPHPNKEIEQWFFRLVSDALKSNAVKKEEIEEEIRLGHVRKDLLEKSV